MRASSIITDLSLVLAPALLLSIASCGVAEERVALLEQNLKALEKGTGQRGSDHETRLASLEKGAPATQEALTSLQGRVTRDAAIVNALEARLSTLEGMATKTQEQLATLSLTVRAAPATKPGTTPTQTVVIQPPTVTVNQAPSQSYYDLATVLGVAEEGVKQIDELNHEVTKDWLRLQLAQAVASGKKPQLKSFNDSGVKLIKLGPQSALGRLGLKDGDIITSFNGTSIAGPETLYEALKDFSGSPVTVVVKRKGKELTLTYTVK